MGTKKNKNGRDLVAAENIKKQWKENIEELYKKDLNELDNHKWCGQPLRTRHSGM